ncbi:nuclear transport factor 2 family protein [Pelagicoccus mobilis]|uniref:Nuclear transport factor 2 family protein n=1 Tax=Pelagicoccus mobilis TaxID=415221 RepID=A0A934RT08_9BACT|nr:nuclear transport factor 2 family protein [Pelagicoccus mobilis]MBK1877045.1 nuclear transport factor 2 family protein [Pelagicoccus mobilis]
MNLRTPLALPLLLLVTLFTSCESTLDYGYYVGELNDDSIMQLFALTDETTSTRDFNAYQSFFSPSYISIDSTDGNRTRLYRDDYLEMVKNIFEDAKFLDMHTVVMDIEYSESGDSATVKIQEEERGKQYGDKWHYTSLSDVEIGIEEGWIFIKRTTRTSKQVIEETRF